jgi:hypothetical protein
MVTEVVGPESGLEGRIAEPESEPLQEKSPPGQHSLIRRCFGGAHLLLRTSRPQMMGAGGSLVSQENRPGKPVYRHC